MSHVDDCKKFVLCLSDYFDGEMDEEVRVEFMMHLEHCEWAQALVRTFERTIILHKGTRSKTLPSDIHERLLAAIRACENSGE